MVAHSIDPHQPTDRTRWRLRVNDGRQTWHYLSKEEIIADPQTDIEKHWLNLPVDAPELPKATTSLESARNGFEYFKRVQNEEGFWSGEYGGPMFLLPGLVITYYITKTPFPPGWKQEMIQYLFNRANKVDGGWGIHIEGDSTVFGTALNYVALRILGVDAEHPVCVKARGTLHKLGGATGAPSWGKFWLATLNVYDWEGMNPVPPELWLLPHFLPFHPGRYWCHTRAVYIPMSYLYGRRATAEMTPLIQQLRQELYTQPYESIPWYAQRNNICKVDLYYPHTRLLNFLNGGLVVAEKLNKVSTAVRNRALKAAYRQIKMEDENTHYLDIGPVNKMMHQLATWYEEGPDSEAFRRHVDANIDFMWMSQDGMMMNGTNGSQLWDAALTIQGVIESGLAEEKQNHSSMLKGLEFLDHCQIKQNPLHRAEAHRDPTLGAWPFSNRWQGYTVSDCTSEGLKAVLLLQKLSYTKERVSMKRLEQAVDIVLPMQNANGGFASYESVRGPAWLEWINPAEVFGNIMIEYCYPECSTACVLGLTYFREQRPDYRRAEIDATIERAIKFILSVQEPDGSWYGSWAICYTYATMFALESLGSVGLTYDNCPEVKKACEFLLSKQMADGGWGESYKSCELHTWVNHEKSQVVNTAWALLGLMAAKCPDQKALKRGVQLIMSRQQANGSWKQEAIEGVFNHNCMISYPNYKYTFTIWALGRYARLYERQ
ncbi:Lanosterol synthase (Oxidosqualene--lanosterol cyclase) [Actinomortierella ambigua]|nr:Lanosterol synthase (Oxidosqualene--lanosterol cyclase) [Actinomortierella ambigua]